MSEKVIYFAYGSNMNYKIIKKKINSAVYIGNAKIPERILVCDKKSIDSSGKANLKEEKGSVVWGVLYKINKSNLKELDKVEVGYLREVLDIIKEDGSKKKAYVYISSKLTNDPRPYECYKDAMIKGAKEHNLPSNYIKFLENIESKERNF